MSETLDLLMEMIRCPSITPFDAGCQNIIIQRLQKLNFQIETMRFEEVDNLWARIGTKAPLVVFAGHTDVVPPGPLENWNADPFTPTIKDGLLFGRGAADMKGGLASQIMAVSRFIKNNPSFQGSIAFLITSDEEGPTNRHGTQRVVEELIQRKIQLDYCIIGEPSSSLRLGDTVRVGRRGSMHGHLKIHGLQGHVASPSHLVNNPIHRAFRPLLELTERVWDKGNEYFPPTTLQISNIHAGTGAKNVIPNVLEIDLNFRFSNVLTIEEIQQEVLNILSNHKIDFDLKWVISGHPFLTRQGKLTTVVQNAIKEETGLNTELSTGGGTSDGRFIATMGPEIVELGHCNPSIHQVNEHVRVADCDILTNIYERILKQLIA